VYFRDLRSGGVAALELVDGVASAGLPAAHAGLHFEPVLIQQGDYYGRTVNLASRIAEYARPGEVLVTQESSYIETCRTVITDLRGEVMETQENRMRRAAEPQGFVLEMSPRAEGIGYGTWTITPTPCSIAGVEQA
jgi:Adenylate and Guanylate cyclase catalytic domain